ncbi:hypothetical protein chiPu_0017999 [Chiloscyllium punctatum]|uniref:Uncharacterized protein n=1 Tax=Chiloscyllium punctatum TaxID=137246 RepID=A0A401RKK3_CHIPU|nr:hypothetical protein [Chiloscyllium punctatum]
MKVYWIQEVAREPDKRSALNQNRTLKDRREPSELNLTSSRYPLPTSQDPAEKAETYRQEYDRGTHEFRALNARRVGRHGEPRLLDARVSTRADEIQKWYGCQFYFGFKTECSKEPVFFTVRTSFRK